MFKRRDEHGRNVERRSEPKCSRDDSSEIYCPLRPRRPGKVFDEFGCTQLLRSMCRWQLFPPPSSGGKLSRTLLATVVGSRRNASCNNGNEVLVFPEAMESSAPLARPYLFNAMGASKPSVTATWPLGEASTGP